MNTDFPQYHTPCWTAAALADAVPLQLSQLLDFDALRNGPLPTCANDGVPSPHRPLRQRYLSASVSPSRFNVY